MNPDLLTDMGLCDGCGCLEEHEDVETCHCGITRCAECRIVGCPHCDRVRLNEGDPA